MSKLSATVLLPLMFLGGCRRPRLTHPWQHTLEPEQILSTEMRLTAELLPQAGTEVLLELTLRDVGYRTLSVGTGYIGHPAARFSFNLERPDHQLSMVYCQICDAGSLFGQLDPYTLQLRSSQFENFLVPLSRLIVTNPKEKQPRRSPLCKRPPPHLPAGPHPAQRPHRLARLRNDLRPTSTSPNSHH